jgi:hypothetical protein
MLESAAEAHAQRVDAQASGPAALRMFDRAHRRELMGDARQSPAERPRQRR